jgi:hypothetical protein
MTTPTKPTHITRTSVLDDLGFSPTKAAALKVRAVKEATPQRKERNTPKPRGPAIPQK